jgi:hypothetical protein
VFASRAERTYLLLECVHAAWEARITAKEKTPSRAAHKSGFSFSFLHMNRAKQQQHAFDAAD